VATVPNDVDEIRRQMAAIRRAMHEDVKEVVAEAEAATDWRRYIMAYPWVSLGVAVAIGYLIVPKRHKTAEAIKATQEDLTKVRKMVETTGKKVVETAKAQAETLAQAPPKKKNLILAGLGLITPLLLKTAQGYALKYAEQWILQQHAAAAQAGPSSDYPGGGPGSTGSMGPGRPSTDPRRAGGAGGI